jgi:hypothetical protein
MTLTFRDGVIEDRPKAGRSCQTGQKRKLDPGGFHALLLQSEETIRKIAGTACEADHKSPVWSRLLSGMTPEECRALARELRQYGEDHVAYRARAREAADRLEALADEMEKGGIRGEHSDKPR